MSHQVVALALSHQDASWPGSAIVLAEDHIVTACSLLSGASKIEVLLADERIPAARGPRDAARDLCVVTIAANKLLRPAVLAPNPDPGAKVYAIGNALGLGVGISDGLVSAIRDRGENTRIQFTAPIAPGSEGGGLFDDAGRLVGIVDYRLRDGQNVNFARPAVWLREIDARSTAQPDAKDWAGAAIALAREKAWPALAEHAANWEKSDPANGDALMWRAEAAFRQSDYKSLETTGRRMEEIDPSKTTGGRWVVAGLIGQEKADLALEHAKGLLRVRQEDGDVWQLIGDASFATGDMTQAIDAYRRAVALEPLARAAYLGLVRSAEASGDWDTDVHALSMLARLDNAAWIQIRLAHGYLAQQRAARALQAANRALELAPDDGDARYARAMALDALGRSGEAIAASRDSLAHQPWRPALVWYSLGEIYLKLDQLPDATACLREAVRIEPASRKLRHRLGALLKDRAYYEEAMAIFRQLAAEDPKDALAWRQIAFVEAFQLRAPEAIAALEHSLSLDPRQARAWYALVNLNADINKPDAARQAYESLKGLDAGLAEKAYRGFVVNLGALP